MRAGKASVRLIAIILFKFRLLLASCLVEFSPRQALDGS